MPLTFYSIAPFPSDGNPAHWLERCQPLPECSAEVLTKNRKEQTLKTHCAARDSPFLAQNIIPVDLKKFSTKAPKS